jgi:tRNA (guanine-N7-)-methyltransferase
MRLRSTKNLSRRPPDKWDTEGFLLEINATGDVIDIGSIFPGRGELPLEIEIGPGKGTFILERAPKRPDINFLGLEYAMSYASYTADRIRRASLENARIICSDAALFIKNRLADESVLRLHVYFPDPWPKRRHHRRRLFHKPFAEQVVRILRPGGQLLVVTDHRDYFEQICRVLAGIEGLADTDFPRLLEGEEHIVGTNFERKYAIQGRHIYSTAKLKYAAG